MSKSNAVASRMEFDKEFYEEHSARFARPKSKAHFLRILRELNLASVDCVLDVGCGIGDLLDEISLFVKDCVGIDISSMAIKVAKARARSNSAAAAWVVASVDQLPFRNEVFSKILCNHVIEHIPNYRKAIFEMAKVLKKGGRLVMTTPNRQMYPLFQVLELLSDRKSGHLWRFNCDALNCCLDRAGLMTTKIEYHGHIFAILKSVLSRAISTAHTEPYNQRAWQNHLVWPLLDALDKRLNSHHLLFFTLTAIKDEM